jgi:hypothetical protein
MLYHENHDTKQSVSNQPYFLSTSFMTAFAPLFQQKQITLPFVFLCECWQIALLCCMDKEWKMGGKLSYYGREIEIYVFYEARK